MTNLKITPVYLLIADISGYTRFVTLHQTSFLHAEEIVTRLMDAVLEAATTPLVLNKLEGDAAFFMLRPQMIPGSWPQGWSSRCRA